MRILYKVLITMTLLFFTIISSYSQQSSGYTIQLAKLFSSDLFRSNGVLFMEPVIRIVNATSNCGFYNQAYIPSRVSKPYFRAGIHSMVGFVDDGLKTYKPVMPSEKFNINDIGKYIQYNPLNNKISYLDTAGLIRYMFLNLMYDGIYGDHKGAITIPKSASTALGTGNTPFTLNKDSMQMLLKAHPLYNLPLIPQNIKDSVSNYLTQFPENFTLYGGTNLNTVVAGIPQFEIGSLYGTELLVRFIPPVNLGETIGDFTFWGFGLKHSISQYFENGFLSGSPNYGTDDKDAPDPTKSIYKSPFDLAVQIVYQGTHLKNKVGVTQAELTADATILNFNLQGSYHIQNILDVFTGVSYETISIDSKYFYKLPVEIQWQLGLLEPGKHDPTPGFPGDQDPQTTALTFTDTNLKWTIGVSKQIGPIAIFAAFNLSKFNVFSGGLEYRF